MISAHRGSRPRPKGDQPMAFMQIIEFRTSDIDRGRQINDQWWRATEGKRTVRREVLARDLIAPTPAAASLWCSSTPMSQRWRSLTCRRPRHRPSSTGRCPMGRRYSTTWTSLRTGPRSGGHATPGPEAAAHLPEELQLTARAGGGIDLKRAGLPRIPLCAAAGGIPRPSRSGPR